MPGVAQRSACHDVPSAAAGSGRWRGVLARSGAFLISGLGEGQVGCECPHRVLREACARAVKSEPMTQTSAATTGLLLIISV
jgi:hypothetical protein